jgi:hypothetical protein
MVCTQRRSGRPFEVRAGELTDGTSEVVRHDGHGEPGGVGHEVAGGQVRRAGALEFGDRLLDDLVPAVVGLHLWQRQGPVGDERVAVPGGEQRKLRPSCRPDPAHDQASLAGVPLLAGEDVNAVSALSAPKTSGVLSQDLA